MKRVWVVLRNPGGYDSYALGAFESKKGAKRAARQAIKAGGHFKGSIGVEEWGVFERGEEPALFTDDYRPHQLGNG